MSKAPSQKIPKSLKNNPEFYLWLQEYTRDVYFMWEQQNVLISPDGTKWKVDNTGTLVTV